VIIIIIVVAIIKLLEVKAAKLTAKTSQMRRADATTEKIVFTLCSITTKFLPRDAL